MSKHMWLLLLTVFIASSAQAQESVPAHESAQSPAKSVRVGIGYAFAAYLEEDGGSAPLGVCLSVASTGEVGFEGEVAYHRDSEGSLSINTFTGMLGPRFGFKSESAQPFVHLLGGVRYDKLSGYDIDNTSVGLEVGGGFDIPAGSSAFIRLGADFQIMFDDGENFKVLRFTFGAAF